MLNHTALSCVGVLLRYRIYHEEYVNFLIKLFFVDTFEHCSDSCDFLDEVIAHWNDESTFHWGKGYVVVDTANFSRVGL